MQLVPRLDYQDRDIRTALKHKNTQKIWEGDGAGVHWGRGKRVVVVVVGYPGCQDRHICTAKRVIHVLHKDNGNRLNMIDRERTNRALIGCDSQ